MIYANFQKNTSDESWEMIFDTLSNVWNELKKIASGMVSNVSLADHLWRKAALTFRHGVVSFSASFFSTRVSRNMLLIRKIRMILYVCVQSFWLIDFLNALSKRNRNYYRRIKNIEKLPASMITDKWTLWLIGTNGIFMFVWLVPKYTYFYVLFPMWCARIYKTIKCIFIFTVNGKNIPLFFLEKFTTEVSSLTKLHLKGLILSKITYNINIAISYDGTVNIIR